MIPLTPAWSNGLIYVQITVGSKNPHASLVFPHAAFTPGAGFPHVAFTIVRYSRSPSDHPHVPIRKYVSLFYVDRSSKLDAHQRLSFVSLAPLAGRPRRPLARLAPECTDGDRCAVYQFECARCFFAGTGHLHTAVTPSRGG